MNTLIKFIFTVLFLFIFNNIAYASISGQGTISYVVDGDTFDIQVNDYEVLKSLYHNNYVGKEHINLKNKTFRVRLANTNTEESKHQDQSKNTDFGRETSSVVKQKFTNENVLFTCYKKGNYNRAICDLETEDENIAIWLITNNYSEYITAFGKHPTKHNAYITASSNNNANYGDFKISNLRKPSKIKTAKKVWSYFKNKKSNIVAEKRDDFIDLKEVEAKLYNLQQKAGKSNFLTPEQESKLSYLKSLNY